MNTTLLQKNFLETFGRDAEKEQVFFAPGRVCLIGEHIDYNGGFVLPAAISLGIYAVARPNKSNTLHIKSTLDNKEFVFDLSKEILFNPLNSWANYPLGVAKYFIQKGYTINGCEILFASTLPVGSGLSSSAAIEVLTGYILSQLNTIEISQQALALAAKEVENNFVGVQCGIMDQFAVAFGKKNHAIKLNCTTLEYEYLPLHLSEYNLVIFNTNKKRELAESAFNIRVKECNDALQIIKQHENIFCLADASLEAIEKYIDDEVLYKRAYHVVSENLRVAKAAEVLKQNNIQAFGKLLFESHNSLKNNYEVSGKELDTFIDFAKQHSDCLGAKMTGAGFGGCAVAIVKANTSEDFITEALAYYKKETDRNGEAYIAEISDSVKAVIQ
jgi:galactokinase